MNLKLGFFFFKARNFYIKRINNLDKECMQVYKGSILQYVDIMANIICGQMYS